MNHLYILLFFLSFLNPNLFSQANIVSSGASVSNANGSVSYSVGQIDYISVSSLGGSLSQGNQQAFEIFENSLQQISNIKLSAFVYPNPTNNFVLLKIEGLEIVNLNYTIFNEEGKEILKNEITSSQSKIAFSQLSNGTYFIRIYQNSNELKSFKIIKNQ